jgi:hypothetical protein
MLVLVGSYTSCWWILNEPTVMLSEEAREGNHTVGEHSKASYYDVTTTDRPVGGITSKLHVIHPRASYQKTYVEGT